MLRVAVVDDDVRHREEIAETVRAHMEAQGEECHVMAFADAGNFLAEAETQRFDIAVLDIIMPEKSGMDAALDLYERDKGCRIVFLTVSPDYAIHGYRVQALDYLLKPVDPADLGRILDSCLHDKSGGRAEPPACTLILREGREARKVDAADILYCRSDDKNVRFYGTDWAITCRGKLDEFAARLPGHFIRTHQRYLVNLARVTAMTSEGMRLDNGDTAPISRAFREKVSEAFFNHISGETRK
jgi:DNA-binding LytR/AlgR family response regulator